MIDYEQHLRTVIRTGDYELTDLENRIDAIWVEGRITDEVRSDLKVLAAESVRNNYSDCMEAIKALETRVLNLENEKYAIWTTGYVTKKGEIVRYDVTGDGELDLCMFDGGNAQTALFIGKIQGWFLLDRELNKVATFLRNANGTFDITPIEGE